MASNKIRLSIAYYLETDGQTEIINKQIEQYLRVYTSYNQDDWVDFLLLAEFYANNATNKLIEIFPFLINSSITI